MGITQITLYVDGMSCQACEKKIETIVSALEGVTSVQAQLRGGRVTIAYDARLLNVDTIKENLEKAGYSIRRGSGNGQTLISLGVGIVLAGIYLFASASGVFNTLPQIDSSLSYLMLFIVGILTSIHCVAMCGGIALSQSIHIEDGKNTTDRNGTLTLFAPGLLYNSGRVLSYTIIGGIAGVLGSVFSFSQELRGIITGLTGLLMIFMGLRMLGLFKIPAWLQKLVPLWFRSVTTKILPRLRSRGPFAVGILNGLMPCGPLQTMQLYALGTGSAIAGAISMFIFSIGTVPLLLVFSFTAALLPRKLVPAMVRSSAVLVMVLGLVTITRAAALAGIPFPEIPIPSLSQNIVEAESSGKPLISKALPSGSLTARVENGAQYITTEFKGGYYVPFTVQAGIPLKWTIRVREEDLNGCNNPVEVPAYRIRKTLIPGDNLIEFTPLKSGVIPYSCWMGMIRSRITVVDDLSLIASTSNAATEPLDQLISPDNGSPSCCSGTNNPDFLGGKVPAETIGMPVIKDGIQYITITVNDAGYFPAAVVLQKGMQGVIKFNPEAISSCNSPVVFPELRGTLDLSKGQLETPPILITEDFTFQCWMGMLHGYVKVVDDLSKINIDKIRTELENYRASGGGSCCGGASYSTY
ncbi:MAG: sulfite exporter TauE/SafE family protein [Spirochaetota bacterium]